MAEATKKTADAAGKDLPAPRRANPLAFFGEVDRERKKVTWPTWRETWLTSAMVFIMVGLTMVFFFAVDKILEYGELVLIGAK